MPLGAFDRVLVIASKCSIVLATTVAAADAPRHERTVLVAHDEPTSADVAGAPPPGHESGRIGGQTDVSLARKLGRGALYIPKLAFAAAFAPFRVAIWAYERYGPKQQDNREAFASQVGTIDVAPMVHARTDYGFTFGARFIHRNLFGEREALALRAATGGRYRALVSSSLHTGDRLGRAQLDLDARLELRPKDAFFGIGQASGPETRFSARELQATAGGGLRVVGPLHLRAQASIASFDYARSDEGPPIDLVYPMLELSGTRRIAGELRLRVDTRHRATSWLAPPVSLAGWLLDGAAGVVAHEDDAEYARYGIDLRRYVDLGWGPRVILVRVQGEAVTGSYAEVPFAQLPELGGDRLRGYALGRFRDRVAAVGSVEYIWDLSSRRSANVFVDAGRVFPSVGAISASELRVGYGVGVALHDLRSFVARASIASSVDGGVFFELGLEPRVK